MCGAQRLLGPVSESLVLTSYGNRKNLILAAVELEGPLDLEALSEASVQIGNQFHWLKSRLQEYTRWGRHFLVRKKVSDTDFPFQIHEVPNNRTFKKPLDLILEILSPIIDREWDLFQESPIELHLLRIRNHYHIVVLVLHHAFGDAATVCEIGKQLLILYEKVRTGQDPEIQSYLKPVSTSGKRAARPRTNNSRDLIWRLRKFLTPLVVEGTLPKGSGDSKDQRMLATKMVLSRETSDNIVKRTSKMNVSLIDMLVAVTNITIDRWNDNRGARTGTITAYMSVNTRGRFQVKDEPNEVALLYFKSTREERECFDTFARSIYLSRIRQFRRHLDRTWYEGLEAIGRALRLFPFFTRRWICNLLSQKARVSIAITLMGVVWPQFSKGNLSGDSCLHKLGKLHIKEVHGLGYKLYSKTALHLAVYVYHNKLNLILMASASHFTNAEAESFLDLIVSDLVERSQCSDTEHPMQSQGLVISER